MCNYVAYISSINLVFDICSLIVENCRQTSTANNTADQQMCWNEPPSFVLAERCTLKSSGVRVFTTEGNTGRLLTDKRPETTNNHK